MKQESWKWLFTWDGRVPRASYFLAGTILTVLKYAIDFAVAAHFGETWRFRNYFFPSVDVSLFVLGNRQPMLYAILWAIAIPFFWVGIALTLRRLRDAGCRTGWIFLFFVPMANLLLFLWLTFTPSSAKPITEEIATNELRRIGKREMGNGKIGKPRSAVFGVAIAVALGFALALLGSQVLVLYGWGLFLGVPFLTGFVASWFLNAKTTHSLLKTITVSAVTPLLIGLALLSLGREGLICLVMAVPLALPFSIAGGLVARSILQRRSSIAAPPTFAACVVILPLMMLAEHAARFEPAVNKVTTSITIDAPASVVWKSVVSFPPLAPPEEWLFRAGIAYPASGRIVGSGSGAVRYCHFSTGDFVEPITMWDENRLLAFDVSAQPPAMQELSPWKITPPHLEHNYMRSRHGQFRRQELMQRGLFRGYLRHRGNVCVRIASVKSKQHRSLVHRKLQPNIRVHKTAACQVACHHRLTGKRRLYQGCQL